MLTSIRGAAIESLVGDYLTTQGLTLVTRNFRSRVGEIDIVMREQATGVLVFVEVRYRKHTRFGDATDSVDARKQIKLVRVVQRYLQYHASVDQHARIDVIGVSPQASADTNTQPLRTIAADVSEHSVNGYTLRWTKNAIDGG